MADETKNGGPAFPVDFPHLIGTGMSLRDYFAAAALTGLLAKERGPRVEDAPGVAYQIADAMLAARERK